ncbi:MAG: AraC family transcriptional regulator [Fusicatenibacter sp.]|nr:AraC family transcriptional regulator [Fusicatenibacter sp.]
MREEFVTFPGPQAENRFWIELAGISYCDGSYRIRRNAGEHVIVMEYVLGGEGTILVNGRAYQAKEGDIYLLPPGKSHDYYSDAKNPWTKIWFNARGPLTESLLEIYNPGQRVVFENAGGCSFFERIHAIGKNRSDTAAEKHQSAALVFHELLQYLYQKYDAGERTYSEETRVCIEFIENHITESISLKQLGELVYLSESQVIRNFRRDLGVTPYEYILDRKMEQAKLLLRSTRLRVKEIAFHLGFCDEHYFTYLFGKRNGQTPMAYRKSSDIE